ncbi:MAG: cytochrome d ubiquinol oxidase subunit II [Gemmatimonadota bacterium]|nr:cytochrome d ubiquinol oxidase subunit II [Gemmatimonadota bacterium]
MFELWFGIVAVMFTAYVVLDGYDLGAGALHLVVARTGDERRQVLAAVGPFWDANEVWLLAAGGALFVGFPRVLAAGLSGFYLAIFLVIWTLILRAVAIEFRSHVGDVLWRAFWDAVFSLASAALAILWGAAIGNVIRGLPLGADGWFALPLFTTFGTTPPVGILDWYTVLTGVFALVALVGHGAVFLTWRTDGPVHDRSRRIAAALFAVLVLLWPAVTIATQIVNPVLFPNLAGRWMAWLGLVAAIAGIVAVFAGLRRDRGLTAFLGSSAWIVGMLVATAACLYPVMLRAVPDAAYSITAAAGGNSAGGLRSALGWWIVGFPIAIAYFVILFRVHRGKAVAAAEGQGY